jgi:hypothetical protein
MTLGKTMTDAGRGGGLLPQLTCEMMASDTLQFSTVAGGSTRGEVKMGLWGS